MSRFSTDLFCEPPEEEFICSVCQDVLDDPLELPCRHLFCRECLRRVEEVSGRSVNLCPLCRQRYESTGVKPPTIAYQNLLRKLRMRCENGECGTVVALEDYWNHQLRCPFASVGCPFENCGHQVYRKDLRQHIEECGYRTISCPLGCGDTILHKDMNEHYYNTCSEGMRVCDKCGTEYLFQEAAGHNCIKTLKEEIHMLRDQLKSLSAETNLIKSKLLPNGTFCTCCEQVSSSKRPPKSASLKKSFSVAISEDQQQPFITDLLSLSGGFILIADTNNACLKCFNHAGDFLFKMESGPASCRLADVGGGRIVLLNRMSKTVDVLKVSTSGIEKESRAVVSKNYLSLTALESQTLAAAVYAKREIDLLSLTGQILQSIVTSETVNHVCPSKDGNLVCTFKTGKFKAGTASGADTHRDQSMTNVSEDDSVVCTYDTGIIKIDPTTMRETLKKSLPEADSLRGVATTRDDSIIACDRRKNVYLLTKDGTLIRTLWSLSDDESTGGLCLISVVDNVVVCCTPWKVFVLELVY